jgi:hypothetical protein
MAFGVEGSSDHTQLAKIKWIGPADNPWGVPILDVRPVTLGMLSTSRDPRMAANAASFGGDDGTCFIGIKPSISRSIPTSLRYKTDGILVDGVLFAPGAMEQKWALYYHRGQIICIRSWLRQVEALAKVRQGHGYIEITALMGTLVLEDEEPAFTVRVLDYLIRSHALDMVYPAPLPVGMGDDPQTAALWCMSCFGDRAWVATPYELPGEPPEQLLRTDSVLHIAVARGDSQAAQMFLDNGISFDLLSRDGLTPLHWSLARQDTHMADFLISCGCPVDVRSAQGATPLMNAVQGGNLEQVLFLLRRGADVNAADKRGFTALHRAAEMGHKEIVQTLLERGAAPDVEAEGYTPCALAEMRGQTAIVKLLQ